MRNARLEKSQAGIKTANRNINNLRYADDTTLMAERKKELKSILMMGKDTSEKSWLETLKKTKIMASGPISSQQTDVGNEGAVTDFIYLFIYFGLQNHCRW